ncbi:MAG TPA: hypothetical protein VMI54_18770 [Polyangiaceae bacterium]|nr:hypothetical protein [Polyangiaceae bacterium]
MAALALSGVARAAPPPKGALTLTASPALGPNTPLPEGWCTYAVWLANSGAGEQSGTLELEVRTPFSREQSQRVTAPFTLAAGARATLELPTHGFSSAPVDVSLTAVGADGSVLATAALSEPKPNDPLLVDLSTPSRIGPAVRSLGLLLEKHASGGVVVGSALVSSPPVDPVSGDLVLPRWAAGYAPATLVVTSGKRLATLGRQELGALTDWVLSGGALAVALERPEDARFEPLVALAGGAIERTEAPSDLLAPTLFYQPGELAPGTAIGPGAGSRSIVGLRLAPRPDTASLLESFKGGNLRPSPWGAVASYGLGELHLLAFDLGEPYASDRWVALKLSDLLRHAYERQVAVALPLGRTPFDGVAASAIRAELDPNRSMRWTIVVSALILLVYAAFAGPVSFWLAARRGKPLRALLHLPIWAGTTLGLIVAIGLLGKGIRGRARHLTFVEAGAGMERAVATRYRSFYTSASRLITVQPTSRSSLIDEVVGDEFADRSLVVDRDGAHLEQLRTRPWATTLVRDDGFVSLAGGVSIVRDASGDVTVHNRAARDLVAAVLRVPGQGFYAFGRIADGKAVHARDGESLPTSIGTPPLYSHLHPLGATLLAPTVDKYAEGLGAALAALEAQAAEADFWPDDVPVLVAQLDGGEGKLKDSGYELDRDRVIVRVVGFGGVP